MLLPMVKASETFRSADTRITADAGYHSAESLQALADQHIDALIADNQMRQRDERFEHQGKHKAKGDPLYEKKPTGSPQKIGLYRPEDFRASEDQSHCICPAGASWTIMAAPATSTAEAATNTPATKAAAASAITGTCACATLSAQR